MRWTHSSLTNTSRWPATSNRTSVPAPKLSRCARSQCCSPTTRLVHPSRSGPESKTRCEVRSPQRRSTTNLPCSTRRGPRRRSRRPAQIAAALCVAAALIAVIVLGIQVVHQQRRIDNLATAMHTDTMRAAARAAENMPGAHTIALVSSDGTHTGHIVMMPDGSGYFMDSNLPQLDAADTYQLWAKAGDATAGWCRWVCWARIPASSRSGSPVLSPVSRSPCESAPGDAEPSSPVMMSGTVS